MALLLIGGVQAATISVCPSGCNYTSIQDAINAASPGDTIEIQSGQYLEPVVVNKSLTLIGVDTGPGYPVVDAGGKNTGISLDAPDSVLVRLKVTNASNSAIVVHADNSQLKELEIDHQVTESYEFTRPAVTADNITGLVCSDSVFNVKQDTIVLYDPHDFRIINNTFKNPTGHSVAIISTNRTRPVRNGIISGNSITQMLGEGIAVIADNSDSFVEDLIIGNNTIRGAGGSIGLFIGSWNVTILNNTVTNNPDSGGEGIYGIMTYGTSDVVIRDNYVHDANVELAYRFESCERLNISGNRAISNEDTGIGLLGPSDCEMTNNVMDGNPYNFLLYPEVLNEGVLPGNRIDTSNLVNGKPVLYFEGVNNLLIDGSGQPGTVFLYGCNNATIRDIHEEANDAGITAFRSGHLSITNCSFDDMDTGIYAVKSDYLSVLNNQFIRCSDGISVGNFYSGIISGNLIENPGDSGIVAGQSLENVTFRDNDIRNAIAGIYLDSVSGWNGVEFSGNTITGSHIAGISTYEAGGCVITGNHITAGSGVGLDLTGSSDLSITGNDVGGQASRGVLLYESPANTISSNSINATGEGVTLLRDKGSSGSSNNRIMNNRIDAVTAAGFYIKNSMGNHEKPSKFVPGLNTPINEIPRMILAAKNTTSDTEVTGFEPDPSPPSNIWNSSIIQGPNIVGGPYLGGNYWTSPGGTGFSQTHPDRGDGFCNESYAIGADNIDYLPLHMYTPKPTFLADFTVSPTNGAAPLTVKCTDKSIGSPTRYNYNFGDGINATGPNPVHTYKYPGTYSITLTITKYNAQTNSIMCNSTTKMNEITVGRVPFVMPVANFTASPTEGTVPLTVKFTDQSSGTPIFYNYDFGDGTNMTGPNPVHTYRYPGVYNVTLTVLKNDVNNASIVSNSSVQKGLIIVNGR